MTQALSEERIERGQTKRNWTANHRAEVQESCGGEENHPREEKPAFGSAGPLTLRLLVCELRFESLDACETYFQAFQFVVWSGLDAKSAMDAVLFETVGEC